MTAGVEREGTDRAVNVLAVIEQALLERINDRDLFGVPVEDVDAEADAECVLMALMAAGVLPLSAWPTCGHDSLDGVDQEEGPDKVWRCLSGCDGLFRFVQTASGASRLEPVALGDQP